MRIQKVSKNAGAGAPDSEPSGSERNHQILGFLSHMAKVHYFEINDETYYYLVVL